MFCRVFKAMTDNVLKDVIVPSNFRKQIFILGHNIPYGGHMEVKKSREFLKNLFWQEMFEDIKKYCQSCPKCRKGKSNVSQVQSTNCFSVWSSTWQGQMLPKTKQSNQFISVLQCIYLIMQKYPEAIPLLQLPITEFIRLNTY